MRIMDQSGALDYSFFPKKRNFAFKAKKYTPILIDDILRLRLHGRILDTDSDRIVEPDRA